MDGSKHEDVSTFREIEFTIQINDKDSGFHELGDLLCSELTRFEDTRKKSGRYENPIRHFLKTNIERSIVIRDNTKVYFVNYHESGSLTITFTVILITRYSNYGTARHALDYLVKDTIGDYFEELLERHVPVSISIKTFDNELFEIPSTKHELNSIVTQPHRDNLPLIISSLALLIALILALVWVSSINRLTKAKNPAEEYRDKYLELIIEKQLEQVYEKEKYNNLIQKTIESASDSGQNINYNDRK